VVEEIRIYVEGGGDGKDTKAAFRRGFHTFMESLIATARKRRVRWRIIACGPRSRAYANYRRALATHSEAFNLLLVDAEGPVSHPPRDHLRQTDGWTFKGVSGEQCHLMVQVMESWFLADTAALRLFYGQRFNENRLPSVQQGVESIPKESVLNSLQDASRNTAKGPYHKTQHGPSILQLVDPSKVRTVARHCERLFATLEDTLSHNEE